MHQNDSYDNRIAGLEKKHLAGESLSESDLAIARDGLESRNLIERIISAEALLRNAVSNHFRQQALETLKSLCCLREVSNRHFEARLAWSLSLIPEDSFLGIQEFTDFGYRVVQMGTKSGRSNGVLILERLARKGDRNAIEILKKAINDGDQYVRSNAGKSLERLGLS